MFCPSCGADNTNPSGYCMSCGHILNPTGPMFAAAAPAPAPVFAQTIGAQQKRSPLVAVIAILIAVMAGGLGYVARNTNRETPDKRVGRLMREAAGVEPIHNSFFPSERRFDDMFRDQYRNLIRANHDYVDAVKNTDLNGVKQLATPESFADPDSFSEGLKQLHAVYDLDMTQEQKVSEIVDNIRHGIEANLSSSLEREAMLKGFDQGLAQPLAKRQKVVAAEQAWIQSIDDVYTFAQSNHLSFALDHGHVVISDNQARADFNSKVHNMNACRGEFMKSKREFDQWQADLLRKMGVNGKDLGMK